LVSIQEFIHLIHGIKRKSMVKRIISGFADFEALVGQEIGISDFITITQKQINRFAEATNDHQWIHTDPVKAAMESPFKATIAHGYLTLSMLTYLWHNIVEVRNAKMVVNYGIEKLRFGQPVLVNNRIRARVKLETVTNLRGITKIKVHIILEIEDCRKPAYECTAIFLYHFI
jgi:acyl dehydratase